MASTTSMDPFTEYALIKGISRKEAKRQLGAKRRKGDYAQAQKATATPAAVQASAPASTPEATVSPSVG